MNNPFNPPRLTDAEIHIKLAKADECLVRGLLGLACENLNQVQTELARRRFADRDKIKTYAD